MKKISLLLSLVASLLLLGCKANYPVAQQSGKEDVAYLLLVSPKHNAGDEVTVTLDNTTTFEAKVVKESKSNRRGTSYAVTPGKRHISIARDGQILYQKVLFLSAQETKKIMLP